MYLRKVRKSIKPCLGVPRKLQGEEGGLRGRGRRGSWGQGKEGVLGAGKGGGLGGIMAGNTVLA